MALTHFLTRLSWTTLHTIISRVQFHEYILFTMTYVVTLGPFWGGVTSLCGPHYDPYPRELSLFVGFSTSKRNPHCSMLENIFMIENEIMIGTKSASHTPCHPRLSLSHDQTLETKFGQNTVANFMESPSQYTSAPSSSRSPSIGNISNSLATVW